MWLSPRLCIPTLTYRGAIIQQPKTWTLELTALAVGMRTQDSCVDSREALNWVCAARSGCFTWSRRWSQCDSAVADNSCRRRCVKLERLDGFTWNAQRAHVLEPARRYRIEAHWARGPRRLSIGGHHSGFPVKPSRVSVGMTCIPLEYGEGMPSGPERSADAVVGFCRAGSA